MAAGQFGRNTTNLDRHIRNENRMRSGWYINKSINQSITRFVDGKHFMRHAANMLELAQEEIYIADWWLSPEVGFRIGFIGFTVFIFNFPGLPQTTND